MQQRFNVCSYVVAVNAYYSLGSAKWCRRALVTWLLFRVAVEPIGEDEKGGCPESYENAESLSVGFALRLSSTREKPDGDGPDDGGEAEDKADIAEAFQ